MSDIRYVCISDLHLGGESSLLTRLDRKGNVRDDSPVLDALAGCLRKIIETVHTGRQLPTLVLNGDILELALAQTHVCLGAFEQFLAAASPPERPLFGEIIFVPGNHDHHLWGTAREDHYRRQVARSSPDEILAEAPHATTLFPAPGERPVQPLLTAVAKRSGQTGGTAKLRTVYPNFGVMDDSGGRCVVFTHGHFIEPVYRIVSTLTRILFPETPPVEDVGQLEEENFAWIDFLWSALGRSGAAGTGVNAIYNGRSDIRKRKELLRNLAHVLARDFINTGLPDWAEERLLLWVFHILAGLIANLERHRTGPVLSRAARKGLRKYVGRFVQEQMLAEGALAGGPPGRMAFVFGHTHKPLACNLSFDGLNGPSPVYNTGGWVVDTPLANHQRGAAVAVVDAGLNVAAVRMFNEGDYGVRVDQAPNPADSSLARSLGGCVVPGQPPFSSFAAAVKKEVAMRRRRYRGEEGKKAQSQRREKKALRD